MSARRGRAGAEADLLSSESSRSAPASTACVVGTRLACPESRALVSYPGQPGTAALAAPAMIDLYGAHIGRRVVLMFEEGDPFRPPIAGCLKERNASAAVERDRNGRRRRRRRTTYLLPHTDSSSCDAVMPASR